MFKALFFYVRVEVISRFARIPTCVTWSERLQLPGETMNWSLLLKLSAFGFVMAIATISFIPWEYEPVLWIFIFGICSYTIAKTCSDRFFIHGFLLSIINCIYITAFHAAFYDAYSASHSAQVAMVPTGMNPKVLMPAMGVAIGIVSGLIQGGFCLLAAKMQKKL